MSSPVIGRDVLVGSRVMSAPHLSCGVKELGQSVYQHLGDMMLLMTTTCVILTTDHATPASSRGSAKHNPLDRLLTHQS